MIKAWVVLGVGLILCQHSFFHWVVEHEPNLIQLQKNVFFPRQRFPTSTRICLIFTNWAWERKREKKFDCISKFLSCKGSWSAMRLLRLLRHPDHDLSLNLARSSWWLFNFFRLKSFKNLTFAQFQRSVSQIPRESYLISCKGANDGRSIIWVGLLRFDRIFSVGTIASDSNL